MSGCVWCGHGVDEVSALTGLKSGKPRKPRVGDWSVCIACAKPLVFGEAGDMRAPTTGELREMAVHHDFIFAAGTVLIGGLLFDREKVDDA